MRSRGKGKEQKTQEFLSEHPYQVRYETVKTNDVGGIKGEKKTEGEGEIRVLYTYMM